MKRLALIQYTKQKSLYGQNDQQILDKFIAYIEICSDPINIFKYMEQKSICIYLGNYWTYKAEVFANMGDYKDAYLCLREAQSRDHIVSENDMHLSEHIVILYNKLINLMKRKPPRGKRSAEEYELLHEQPKNITLQSLLKAATIYDKNYQEAKKQVERVYMTKIQGKQLSWLAPIQQRKSQKLQQKMKSLGNLDQFHSLRTPISKKDPMKLTKTMDSIEMLKKRKSVKTSNNSDEKQLDEQMMVHTTPVGNQMSLLKRRVTFRSQGLKIQKIRSSNEDEIRSQAMLQKSDNKNILKKRSSILKNRDFENYEMQEQY